MSRVPTGDALSFAAKASELAGELYDKAYVRGHAAGAGDLAAAADLIAELLATHDDRFAAEEARARARAWFREYAARSVR